MPNSFLLKYWISAKECVFLDQCRHGFLQPVAARYVHCARIHGASIANALKKFPEVSGGPKKQLGMRKRSKKGQHMTIQSVKLPDFTNFTQLWLTYGKYVYIYTYLNQLNMLLSLQLFGWFDSHNIASCLVAGDWVVWGPAREATEFGSWRAILLFCHQLYVFHLFKVMFYFPTI